MKHERIAAWTVLRLQVSGDNSRMRVLPYTGYTVYIAHGLFAPVYLLTMLSVVCIVETVSKPDFPFFSR